MRIITLSNFYPPYEIGGQSLSCKSIVDGLSRLGHSVLILTSDFGAGDSTDNIIRDLKLEMEFSPLLGFIRFFTERKAIIHHNEKILSDHVKHFNPDLIFICGMWNMPRQVPAMAERLMPGRVIYRFACYWPTLPSQHEHYWKSPAQSWLTKLPKWFLKPVAMEVINNDPTPPLIIEHAICNSLAVKDNLTKLGIRLNDVRIIYNGIDINQFENNQSIWVNSQIPRPLKLLYIGRISSEKGVHTLIEALGLLTNDYPHITLTLVGPANDKRYKAHLENLVEKHSLSSNVEFLGKVPPERIPGIMQKNHVLLVPSIWVEPFPRVVLEGMAAGLVVIGTGQGGIKESLKNNETGLEFPPEDSHALANQTKRLLSDPSLGTRLVYAANNEVCSRFTEKQMVDAYELYMKDVVGGNS